MQIKAGDYVSYNFDGVEFIGIVKEINENFVFCTSESYPEIYRFIFPIQLVKLVTTVKKKKEYDITIKVQELFEEGKELMCDYKRTITIDGVEIYDDYIYHCDETNVDSIVNKFIKFCKAEKRRAEKGYYQHK